MAYEEWKCEHCLDCEFNMKSGERYTCPECGLEVKSLTMQDVIHAFKITYVNERTFDDVEIIRNKDCNDGYFKSCKNDGTHIHEINLIGKLFSKLHRAGIRKFGGMTVETMFCPDEPVVKSLHQKVKMFYYDGDLKSDITSTCMDFTETLKTYKE